MKIIRKIYMFFKFKSWREWTFFVSALIFISTVVFSYYIFKTSKWIELVIIPSIISLLMGSVISLWFTIKTDKDEFQLRLEIEIDQLHENILFTLTKATEIVSNPLFSNEEKVRQMIAYLVIKVSDTYYIEIKYNELFLEYYNIINKDFEFINGLDCNLTTNEFIEKFNKDFDKRAKDHHGFYEKVLICRNEVFKNRRIDKGWILKNNRVQYK